MLNTCVRGWVCFAGNCTYLPYKISDCWCWSIELYLGRKSNNCSAIVLLARSNLPVISAHFMPFCASHWNKTLIALLWFHPKAFASHHPQTTSPESPAEMVFLASGLYCYMSPTHSQVSIWWAICTSWGMLLNFCLIQLDLDTMYSCMEWCHSLKIQCHWRILEGSLIGWLIRVLFNDSSSVFITCYSLLSPLKFLKLRLGAEKPNCKNGVIALRSSCLSFGVWFAIMLVCSVAGNSLC